MTIATDPIDRAEIDSAGGNSAALPLAQAINGWNGGDFLEHDKLNAVMRSAALWKLWLDQTRADHRQLGYSGSFRGSATVFSYGGVGPGLARAVVDDSHLVVLGLYVPLTLARLAYYQPGVANYVFTASMTHHFYVAADGAITVSVVALGTPAAPPVGTETLLSVDTNATDVTAETQGPSFAAQLVVNESPQQIDSTLTVNGAATINAPLTVTNGNVTIDKTEAGAREVRLIVAGDSTRGWRIRHDGSERLQVQEMIGGVATTILDLGTSAATASLVRQLLISNSSTSVKAFRVDMSVLDAEGVEITNAGGSKPAVTITAAGSSVPLVLSPVPLAAFAGGDPVGSIKIDNSASSLLKYKDNNGDTRTVWATKGGGLSLGSAYTAANVNNFAVGTVGQTFNYSFVAGQRYRVAMRCKVGRAAGSTRDALFTCTVGGVALVFDGWTEPLLAPGAAGYLEKAWSDEAIFTAGVTGSLAVTFIVTPVNGAGNLNMGYRGVVVQGHFD